MNDLAHMNPSKHMGAAIKTKPLEFSTAAETKSKLDKRLSILFDPESAQAEAIRSLRSELLMRYFNNTSHRNLSLVSTDDNENLAITTANLAAAFSQLGLKTLLIDANLRSPQMAKLFDFKPNSPGLADLISNRSQPEAISVKALPSLWIMPAGTPATHPQELLANKRFARVLEELSGDYDLTLINTSAAEFTRDAHLVATQCGASLIVVRQDVSRAKDVKQLCTSFKVLGVRVLGVALWQ